ncbi:LPS translocon maturation chaperone LptM [Acinetobacter sp. ANC 3813]|uniref:LPS translocon maturation chaperone LptM n=1 Tax=Acinetobacter sp. ANC 3813 TaxID=1977873 RepID=UPI000A34321E|nr:lipoprotein [Acinetobacter sp. ANC 3813]OTG87328.1 hypothetical protein B9T34_16535 [Acinetobacter sp. ANC 3813]
MRQIICCMSLCALGFGLTGCGQSGALQLPNDPNYDKRAKYLLYSDTEAQPKSEQKSEQRPVEQPAAPEDTNSTTTP